MSTNVLVFPVVQNLKVVFIDEYNSFLYRSGLFLFSLNTAQSSENKNSNKKGNKETSSTSIESYKEILQLMEKSEDKWQKQ